MLPPPSPRKQWDFQDNSLRLRLEHELVCSKMSSTKALVSACLAATSFCNFSWSRGRKPLAKPLAASNCRWWPEWDNSCAPEEFGITTVVYCSHPRTRNRNRSMKQGWKLDPNPWSIQVRQAAPWIRSAPSGANGPRTWHQPCELQRPGVFQWWFMGFDCDFHELSWGFIDFIFYILLVFQRCPNSQPPSDHRFARLICPQHRIVHLRLRPGAMLGGLLSAAEDALLRTPKGDPLPWIAGWRERGHGCKVKMTNKSKQELAWHHTSLKSLESLMICMKMSSKSLA